MIDRAGAVPAILTRLKKLLPDRKLELLTYKRDRSVVIRRIDRDAFHVREDGFENRTFESDLKGMKRLLKTLLKREFPRSNKIRVHER